MKPPPPIPDLVRDQVRRGRTVCLVVGGWSMVPLVWPGSRVAIAPVAVEDLRPGDLVAVASGGHVVCHLVRGVERGRNGPVVHTRGCASRHDDPPASAGDLIGRVERIEWGPCSTRTDGPTFHLNRLVSGRVGPVLGLLRLVYLWARAMARSATNRSA